MTVKANLTTAADYMFRYGDDVARLERDENGLFFFEMSSGGPEGMWWGRRNMPRQELAELHDALKVAASYPNIGERVVGSRDDTHLAVNVVKHNVAGSYGTALMVRLAGWLPNPGESGYPTAEHFYSSDAALGLAWGIMAILHGHTYYPVND